jgi:eukaryotic-like serine/threonine-protein kinase
MGEVYRAKDTQLDREVAVKVLSQYLAEDPHALKRFEREARAVASLSHPNILEIYDSGTDQGVTYAVMELLEGETLRARIKDSAIPLRRSLEIAAAVSEGLAAAHSKGVIHRDLKPENIFITKDDRVKILDFGLARSTPILSQEEVTEAPTKSQLTEIGAVIGTVRYMSPEQVRGEALDARSDIFSLGCILHEMLAGVRPFSGSNAPETMAAILKDDPPRLVVLAVRAWSKRRCDPRREKGSRASSGLERRPLGSRGYREFGTHLRSGRRSECCYGSDSILAFNPVRPQCSAASHRSAMGPAP